MADPEEYVPFIVSRRFNNPARERNNRFKLKFDQAISGKGHKFHLIYEAPDDEARALLVKVAELGRPNARYKIRMKNTEVVGWVVAEPLDIQEP